MDLINTFVVLFIVIDPIGIVPLFAAVTHGESQLAQRKMAIRGTMLATLMLLTFFLIGGPLIKALGISLPAFRIAGGLLLLLLAIDMVFARQSGLRSTTQGEQQEAELRQDISLFPLAFPLISGPGALTTVLLMASSWQTSLEFGLMLVAILLVLGVTLLLLWYTSAIMRTLGETGTNVIIRMFGLILTALAVQFIIDGIKTGFGM